MAGTFGFHRAPRPVKDITKTADEFDFNINIPFKYWVHSCRTLYQEVRPWLAPALLKSDLFSRERY